MTIGNAASEEHGSSTPILHQLQGCCRTESPPRDTDSACRKDCRTPSLPAMPSDFSFRPAGRFRACFQYRLNSTHAEGFRHVATPRHLRMPVASSGSSLPSALSLSSCRTPSLCSNRTLSLSNCRTSCLPFPRHASIPLSLQACRTLPLLTSRPAH